MAKKAAAKKAPTKMVKPEIKKIRKSSKPRNNNTLSYTQSEFLENLRGFCGLEKRSQARDLIEDLNALVTDTLKKGYKIPLFGLGKLYVRKTKPRVGRNPQTGEPINIPARKRVRFTAAKALKSAVLS
jgi:nucleoid DNA-binding protein